MITQNWELSVMFPGMDELNEFRRNLVLDMVTSTLRHSFNDDVIVEMRLKDEVHANDS